MSGYVELNIICGLPEYGGAATKSLPADIHVRGGGFFIAEYTLAWLILLGGTIITLLLSLLILTLLNTRATAQQIAEKLTVDLRESETKFRLL